MLDQEKQIELLALSSCETVRKRCETRCESFENRVDKRCEKRCENTLREKRSEKQCENLTNSGVKKLRVANA